MVVSFKSPLLEKVPTISHAFCTRNGGVSNGVVGSLNCVYMNPQDSRDSYDNVRENHRRVAEHVGGTHENLTIANQTHSTHVITVGEPWEYRSRPDADALVTNKPGIILGVITADCVPILLVDPVAKVIATIHAGWQGALAGIAQETVAKMVQLGASPQHIQAAIGPCIWQDSYEVSQDFYEKLPASDHHFFAPGIRPEHWQFDLPGFVTQALSAQGIQSISPSPLDTYTNEDMFFSYRRRTHRNESVFGCQLSVIMIK